MPTIAQIEPITTARALRGPFDYRLPKRLDGTGVGTVLTVPFGGRTALGVVTRLADESAVPDERLAEPLERAGAIPRELVELALWIADEYVSTPARALTLVLPPGVARRAGPRMVLEAALTDHGRDAVAAGTRLTERQRRVL
ncbi:MAG: primosomal protein, partial [Solirubrobacterales bacterium]|nr:primosomal protein [Solirubrobacterales bacterium]